MYVEQMTADEDEESLGWFRFCFQTARAASDDGDDGDDDEKKLPVVIVEVRALGLRYQGMVGSC